MTSYQHFLKTDSIAHGSHAGRKARENSERLEIGAKYRVRVGESDVYYLMIYEGVENSRQEEKMFERHSFIYEIDGSDLIQNLRAPGYHISFSDEGLLVIDTIFGCIPGFYPHGSRGDREARDVINWVNG